MVATTLESNDNWPTDLPKLVVVLGPTASGKSDLAMQLAQKYNGELICADSRTVYRGMDIGTAKPSDEDQTAVRHHLLDIVDPGEAFSAAEFKKLAEIAIRDISARGKLPIMVGGSGLYIDAVLYDYNFSKSVDPAERSRLDILTDEELVREFNEDYGDDAIELVARHRNNRRRLQRYLEMKEINNHRNINIRPQTLVLGITLNKSIIQERITQRAIKMLDEGIIKEVETIGNTYGWQSEAMTGNIYRIFSEVVNNQKNIDDALAKFIRSDMKLVKKQLTWFKRNKNIHWLENPSAADDLVTDFLMRA